MSHSDKLKTLLQDKETLCCAKIKKIKKINKIISIFSAAISVTSIVILAILASSLILPPLAASVLPIVSAVLLGIDLKFKFQNKSSEKKRLIEKLNKIHNKLEYINSCNGGLTEEEYFEIFKEFNTVL